MHKFDLKEGLNLSNSYKINYAVLLCFYLQGSHRSKPLCRDTGIQEYWDTGMQGYRDTMIHEYRDTGIQGYNDIGIQGYRDAGIQGYNDTGIQG